ncbi:MAG: hypothetical protein ABSC71_19740 [Candidatus Acidiferrales bacterium]|jgi:hypothetical protein
MPAKIAYDTHAPTASLELMITQPLPDYDLDEVEAPIPRDVDPMLASQGFLDLLDEVRVQLKRELADGKLEVVQLTGAICHDKVIHRPGIWLVLHEKTDAKEMSPAAREHVAALGNLIVSTYQLG